MSEVPNILVTVLMPCLNEARTLGACIQRAHIGCDAAIVKRTSSSRLPSDVKEERTTGGEIDASLGYEILIADNGSTDGSPEISLAHGARLVSVAEKGYGATLLGGIAAARGEYIVMGDSDCSYDFGEVPRFLEKLEEGYDLVMGNRFSGEIKPGAMPWHHRYLGNPVLSGIGRILFRTPCRDWHCGLRAFRRDRILELQLRREGMDFASEIVLAAAIQGVRIVEIPITLHPDGRGRPPHLRSFRDGYLHLRLILTEWLAWKIKRRDKIRPIKNTYAPSESSKT